MTEGWAMARLLDLSLVIWSRLISQSEAKQKFVGDKEGRWDKIRYSLSFSISSKKKMSWASKKNEKDQWNYRQNISPPFLCFFSSSVSDCVASEEEKIKTIKYRGKSKTISVQATQTNIKTIPNIHICLAHKRLVIYDGNHRRFSVCSAIITPP